MEQFWLCSGWRQQEKYLDTTDTHTVPCVQLVQGE